MLTPSILPMKGLITQRKAQFFILGSILLGLTISIVANFWFKNGATPSWSWRNIVPGETTIQEVTLLMGEPDNIVKCERWGENMINRDGSEPRKVSLTL